MAKSSGLPRQATSTCDKLIFTTEHIACSAIPVSPFSLSFCQQCYWPPCGSVADLQARWSYARSCYSSLAALLRRSRNLHRSLGVGKESDPDHGEGSHSNHTVQVRLRRQAFLCCPSVGDSLSLPHCTFLLPTALAPG